MDKKPSSGKYPEKRDDFKKRTPPTTPQAELKKALALLAALIFLMMYMRGRIPAQNIDQGPAPTTQNQ